jgi:hypothetical protein
MGESQSPVDIYWSSLSAKIRKGIIDNLNIPLKCVVETSTGPMSIDAKAGLRRAIDASTGFTEAIGQIGYLDQQCGTQVAKEFDKTVLDNFDDSTRNFTDKEFYALKDANERIKALTSYGLRNQMIESNSSCCLSWSNGAARWFHGPGCLSVPKRDASGDIIREGGGNEGWPLFRRLRKGEDVNQDANQVVVPYPCKTVVKLLPFLEPLPLYGLSAEAKERGLVDPGSATKAWAKLQLEKLIREADAGHIIGFGGGGE